MSSYRPIPSTNITNDISKIESLVNGTRYKYKIKELKSLSHLVIVPKCKDVYAEIEIVTKRGDKKVGRLEIQDSYVVYQNTTTNKITMYRFAEGEAKKWINSTFTNSEISLFLTDENLKTEILRASNK